MATVAKLANSLAARGIRVESVQDGDDVQDGTINITGLVHVQVPTFGGPCGVVRETGDGCFVFYPVRRSVNAIIADIHEALGFVREVA